jgi:hypothetical protein
MKNNLIRRKLAYLFVRRSHGKHPYSGLGLAFARSRKIKSGDENILRWEDDGGQFSGSNSQTHSNTLNNEKLEQQAYKDEYLVNDSLGG